MCMCIHVHAYVPLDICTGGVWTIEEWEYQIAHEIAREKIKHTSVKYSDVEHTGEILNILDRLATMHWEKLCLLKTCQSHRVYKRCLT